MAARWGCGLWHAFCTANNCQARRKRMPWRPTVSRHSEAPRSERLASFRQSILFLLACIENPRCTKARQSPQPPALSSPRTGFLHSLRLSSLWNAGRDGPPTGEGERRAPMPRLQLIVVARAFKPVGRGPRRPAYRRMGTRSTDAPPTAHCGGTGFLACGTRAETARLQEDGNAGHRRPAYSSSWWHRLSSLWNAGRDGPPTGEGERRAPTPRLQLIVVARAFKPVGRGPRRPAYRRTGTRDTDASPTKMEVAERNREL